MVPRSDRDPAPFVPPDSHAHSEWSWDADAGSMEDSCAWAVELGLTSIAFTEHWDPTPCPIEPSAVAHLPADMHRFVSTDGVFLPPSLDVEGYFGRLRACRERFPQLEVISGVELGEPHWWPEALGTLLGNGKFDRILGSVHCVDVDGRLQYIDGLYRHRAPGEVVRIYLAEVLRLVESPYAFHALAHIDYPVRAWPISVAGAFDPVAFEDEYRAVLRGLAKSGRALELNTRAPLHGQIMRWWYDEGGQAISFGSDAHEPREVAAGFVAAAALAESVGFHGGRDEAFWRR
jgi:histidinol-phosphatase (PHP family)